MQLDSSPRIAQFRHTKNEFQHPPRGVGDPVLGRDLRLQALLALGHHQPDRVQHRIDVETREDDAPGVQRLRPLHRLADRHRREGEHRGLLADRPAVRDGAEGVHLQMDVVEEAKGLEEPDSRVHLHALQALQPLPRPGMGRDDDRDIILFRKVVQHGQDLLQVRGVVDVLLPVNTHDEVALAPEAKLAQDARCIDPLPVVGQDLIHRRTGEVDPPVGQPLGEEVAAGMLGVDQVEVGDVVDDPAVDLFRHVKVEAPVAGFHVEDRDLQPLGHDPGNATVRIPEDENGIRPLFPQDFFNFDEGAAQDRPQ